jgi:hypothetical protein
MNFLRTFRSFTRSLCCNCIAPVLLLPLFFSAAGAEIVKVQLPKEYAAFAMNPDTGDIVAIDNSDSRAVLFKNVEADQKPAVEVRVGSTPSSVCYKLFNGKGYYAVVCSADSHMYLLDAKSLDLVKKIELAEAGVKLVTCSRNPEDPFVYYNYAGGHDSAAGVVSLRDMRSHGEAFDDSADCAISADGKVAYRRGPWSPTGFESLAMTNELSDTKPVFTRLFYDHNSTSQYVPDPFGRYTATGKSVYSRSLEKREAELPFVAQAFFQSKPVVLGEVIGDRFGRDDKANTLVLQAASYNTFSSVGDQVSVTLAAPAAQNDRFNRNIVRSAFFADDKRQRLVFARGKEVVFVPLTEFNLPDEPFLYADVLGDEPLEIGKRREITFLPKDERIKLTFEDTPDGATANGNRLAWTPTEEQVGPAAVAITLKHGDIQRTLKYEFEVVYPSISLPFTPANIAIDPSGEFAFIWEGPSVDRYGRAQPTTSTTIRVALIEVGTGRVMAERKLAEKIGSAVVTEKHVILQTATATPKCEVLQTSDLERVKAIVAAGPIHRIHATKDLILLESSAGAEVYNATSFDRVYNSTTSRTNSISRLDIARERGSGSQVAYQEGLLLDGVLFDTSLERKLLLAPKDLPTLTGSQTARTNLTPLGGTPSNPRYSSSSSNGRSTLATAPLPREGASVSLERMVQRIAVPGSVHTNRSQVEYTLSATGDNPGRQVIVRQLVSSFVNTQPLLTVAGENVFVVLESKLYRWNLGTDPVGGANTNPLKFVPAQSAFSLTGTGKTLLKHEVTGGKAPVTFALLTPYEEAITIDEKSGLVTIDEAAILKHTATAIETQLKKSNRGEPYQETLRAMAVPMIESATKLLGRRPKGAPVAVPIRVDATDKNLGSQTLSYYLIAELPSKDLSVKVKELDEQRATMQAALAERTQEEQSAEQGKEAAVSNADLQRRVESLEQRLDLVTRQLNAILKKLDEK